MRDGVYHGGSGKWKAALEQDRQQTAVFFYLMWLFGGQTRRWLRPETLRSRMAQEAAAFCEEHGLDPHWSLETSGPVRRAAVYLTDIIVHLAHVTFGRPYAWRSHREEFFMGMDEAQLKLREREMLLKAAGTAGASLRKAMRKAERVAYSSYAQKMHDHGLTNGEIAEAMGMSERTVRRYLND